MRRGLMFLGISGASIMALAGACASSPLDVEGWSDDQVQTLRALWIGNLGGPPRDPTNAWADDDRAAALGHRLFFDERLSVNGRVSCATCHRPEADFQDGIALGEGVGRTDRRTMSVVATAHSPWQFWDGRKDSQWAQALGPLESPVEHGGARALYVHLMAEQYRAEYTEVFGQLPGLETVPRHAGPIPDTEAHAAWATLDEEVRDSVTRAFVNIGKAIAAYQRRIGYGPSRFDEYVAGLMRDGRPPRGVLSSREVEGLSLFIGKAGCIQCHNGPLFTNHDFHNTGVPTAVGLGPGRGRADGAPAVLADEFNCRSRYSDSEEGRCAELDFMRSDGPELEGAFKTPSLRNVVGRAPYMHAGQLSNLEEVLVHYDVAPAAPVGRTELRPLRLGRGELAALEAFLGALSGPLSGPEDFLRPPR